ncbi:site-specific integrase [Cupriavidus sp. UYPR2.512]|uniref:site-specific integrase n=1 Tax=Cupriavidus sp. UYPR2.512 TaxID=1080187 RepID=UPI0003718ADF|nr:site-specific integrase [Cupriavidus sp. UYPR2.512]UIF88153.1 site-specific integrase [Cupriavidus necator]
MSKVRSIPSFATLLQDFFVERLMEQRAVSQETISSYRDTFRLFLKFASDRVRKSPSDLTLADLDAPLVLAFLKHLEIDRHNSTRTRNVRLAGLRSFMKYAAYRDIASLAVIQRVLAVPMKRCDEPLVGFLSREEVQQLLVAPDPDTWTGQRDRVLLATMYNTGARVSEILALRVGDVILGPSSCVHILGKGRKQRTVPLWRSTATLIKRWLPRIPDAPSHRLFPNRSGNAMTRSNVADRLRIAITRAKEQCPQLRKRRVTLHMVRHTTATHLLQSGADLSVIALWLGHESTATTHCYLEANLEMKERALNAIQPPHVKKSRYRPPDRLLQFLESL